MRPDLAKQPVPVVIAYDFDGTLAPGNMQEHVFLPKLGLKRAEFWSRADALAHAQQGDKVLAYMHLMLLEANKYGLPIKRSDWVEHGHGIQLFPGVSDWFPRLTEAGRTLGLDVRHYIISSGLREMIDGTPIRQYLNAVFASGFLYDDAGDAVGPAMAVNYTTKTQFLFRLNKGALDLADDTAVNAFLPAQDRPVPFANIIFVGDGMTDIPCFRLVKEKGGISFAVYPEGDQIREERTRQLLVEDRVHAVAPANYQPRRELDDRVHAVLDMIAARTRITVRGPDR